MHEIKLMLQKHGLFKAPDEVYMEGRKSTAKYWLYGLLVLGVIVLFLPWTQNIRTKGSITTLRQEHRPQELNSIIPGKIVKWYVKEGDMVKTGDTIAQLAEIKDAYLDPELLSRTQEQLESKKTAVESYNNKVQAIDAQINAMELALQLKMKQLERKVVADSMELMAAMNDLRIADEQLRRQRIMKDSGLASTTQLEQRIQYAQNALAKKMSAETKYNNTRTDLLQVKQEYAEKIFKARGDRAAAGSEIASGNAEISKLSNQYANYRIRNGMYFLIAPQDGQVVQAKKSGINEIVKEGEKIVEIVPNVVEYAVEMYVRPVDLPLISKGQKVRFLFDGYPAIVFSGWPQSSYGTFSGTIVAVESNVSDNGKFRILVAEDKSYKPWPASLKLGAGAQGIALLKNVPVWYELWRNINGFPPDYYETKKKDDGKKAAK